MNGIMYLRKSREDERYEKETGENVLQIHRERLTELLNKLGHTWTERAEVVSGDTIAARPEFQAVIGEDIPGGAKFLCVTEIPRLSRGNMKDAGRIYETIVDFQVFVITPAKTYDPSNPADLRQLRFELFMSREEYEMIKERLWNNRNYKATQGYAGNYLPVLGYRQLRGVLEVIPEEAELVKQIFNMRAEGYSYQEIADYCNSRNLKTKKGTKYHQSTICKILRNPRYIGVAIWNNVEYQAKHQPIIPIELWERVQEVNKDRRYSRRGTKEDNPYLVELYCHECGSRMYGEEVKYRRKLKDGTERIYKRVDMYVCNGRRLKPKCTHRIAADIIHKAIFKELEKIITSPYVLKELAKERELKLGVNSDSLNDELKELNRLIKAKGDFQDKVEKDYETGELPALLYSKHIEKTTNEIKALESRIKKIKGELARSNTKLSSPDELNDILKRFLNNWDSYPNKSRKIIIRSFLPRIEVDKQNNLYITRSIPLYLEA